MFDVQVEFAIIFCWALGGRALKFELLRYLRDNECKKGAGHGLLD